MTESSNLKEDRNATDGNEATLNDPGEHYVPSLSKREKVLTTLLFWQHTTFAVHSLPEPRPTPVIGLQFCPSRRSMPSMMIPSSPKICAPCADEDYRPIPYGR